MPDKSFEKNVQQNFDGFGLAPSPKVWMRVEEELHRKGKRRRGIIWMFFGLMTLLGGAYLISSPSSLQGKDADILAGLSPSVKEKSISAEKTPGSVTPEAQQATAAPSESISKVEEQNPERNNNISTRQPRQLQQELRANNKADVSSSSKNSKGQITHTGITANNNNDRIADAPSFNANIPSILEDKQDIPVIEKREDRVEKIPIAEESKMMETDSSSVIAPQIQKNVTQAIDSLTGANEKKIVRVQPKRNIQLGVKASVAITALPEKFLGTSNKSALADNFTTGNGVGFPGLPQLNYTYDQRQSYGFEVGAWIKLPIGKKAALSTGIDYTYLSTTTKTGTISNIGASVFNGYRSVALNRYYLPGELTQYRNQYHLLQVPLEYSVAWGNKSKLPVVFSAGIQPGLSIGSNALLKDSSGILYSDKSNYNKLQLGLSAGFSVRLFNRSKFPLDLGPVAQYQLTNSFRRNTGYNGHLFYLGLQGSIPLFNISRQQR
jgi:hypothetical protein